MAQLEIGQVSKRFDDTPVLDAVSLSVEAGELVSLLGPSGCGKSTLLRIVAGLERADTGSLRIAGRDVATVPARDREVAMVFQSLALYPQLTARETIALPLRARRMTRLQRLLGRLAPSGARRTAAAIDGEVERLGASLGLDGLLDRRPAQLSGGQRQRVAIARALIRARGLLLMDEPLSSLDARMRLQARDEVLQIQRRFDIACVFVTHDQAEALAMSDRVAVMLGGRIAQCGTPAAIYHDPASLAVARFVGTPTINCLDGMVDGDGRLVVAGRTLPVRCPGLAGRPLIAAARPESVTLQPPGEDGGLAMTVTRVEDQGADLFVHLAAEPPGAMRLVARVAPRARPRPGDRIGAAIDPAGLLIFDADGQRVRATVIVQPPAPRRLPLHA